MINKLQNNNIYNDENRLYQAMLNFINNSINYSENIYIILKDLDNHNTIKIEILHDGTGSLDK